MANTVIALKKSATPSAAPVDLANGELAINYADGRLFYKHANGTISAITSSGGDSFGTVNANNTLIVADTSGDILTLEPGTNISIVGDAVNDKVTIGLQNDVVIPSTGTFKVAAVGGDEGGEIKLGNAITNSVLTGDIIIDIYQNRLRFFESTGTNRGAFINLASAATGVGTDLLAAASATDTVARNAAGAAFDKANTANITADLAYNHANAAFTKANSAIPVTSDTAPGSPFDNQFWFDSSTATLRIYYNDGDTAQWIDAVPLGSNTEYAVAAPNEISANAVISLDDIENTIFANSSSDIYVTIPPNANVAIPIGAKVKVYRRGTGRVKIIPDTGVTFRLPTSIAPKRQMGCRAKHSTDRTVNWGTPTAVPWDTDVYDTDGFHDTSTNTERLTIPSGLGIKKVNLLFYTDATNITSYLSEYIGKNGIVTIMAINLNNVTFSNFAGLANSGTVDVVDGDYFVAVADAGTDTSIVFRGTTNGGSWFQITVLEIDPQGWIAFQDGAIEIQKVGTNQWIVTDQSALG